MPSTLECVLMRKCKIKKTEARRLVTLGQESLGIQDVEWSTQLEKECIRIHDEKEELRSQDRYKGLSPYLAFKVKEHEQAFGTTVEIKPLVNKDAKKKDEKQRTRSASSDPQPTFQESATTKSLPPIARKKQKEKQDNLSAKTSKSRADSATKPIRVRSPSPKQSKPPKPESPSTSSSKPTRTPSPTPPENAARSRVRSQSPVTSKNPSSIRVRSPSPAPSNTTKTAKSNPPIKPVRAPSPSFLEKPKEVEMFPPKKSSVQRSQSPIPSQSNSSTVSESSTSEMSCLSNSSERQATNRPTTPPPQCCTPPIPHPQSPKPSETLPYGAELSPEVSYMVPGASSSEIESPTKRLAKLASMSIVSPMVRTKKMSLAQNADFAAFEAPLNTPTHGRRRMRRSSHRSRSSISLSNSVHSVGESSLSSAGSDSVQSYRSSSRVNRALGSAMKSGSAIKEFLEHWFDKKQVTLIVDSCPGTGPDCNDDESEYDTPSLLGVSDCEYESDAMYESDTVEDFDFFDDNGSVGSNSGAVYVDPGCAMLPMPKLEAVRPRFSKSNNPYDSNDEESFSDDSEEAEARLPFGRNNSLNPPIAKRKGKKPPRRAKSFDDVTENSKSALRKGRRAGNGKEPERDVPQRAASFDMEDLNAKSRKRDAV